MERWTETMVFFGLQNVNRTKRDKWLQKYNEAANEYLPILQEHFRSFLDFKSGSQELRHIFKTEHILGHMLDTLMFVNYRTKRRIGDSVNYIQESLRSTEETESVCREYLDVIEEERQNRKARWSMFPMGFQPSSEYFKLVNQRDRYNKLDLDHATKYVVEILKDSKKKPL
ncbi:hypothetical protein DPMN_192726, partial [Dreissena polymorpha]